MTNSQLDAKISVKYGMSAKMIAVQANVWLNQATQYPNGVFQSNGNILWKKKSNKIKFIVCILFARMECHRRTQLDSSNNMIHRPNPRHNNWPLSKASPTNVWMRGPPTCQCKIFHSTIPVCRWISCIRSLSACLPNQSIFVKWNALNAKFAFDAYDFWWIARSFQWIFSYSPFAKWESNRKLCHQHQHRICKRLAQNRAHL